MITKTSYRIFLLIPSLFIKNTTLNDDTLCEYSFKIILNELARFGQFIEYTLFRSPFSPHLVPISADEGPHLVPISLKIRSPFGPHFEKFRSPFHVGAVLSHPKKLDGTDGGFNFLRIAFSSHLGYK